MGGGIAGLSAAFRLREAGFQVTVFEADDRVGGRISTVVHGGYRIDDGASLLTSAYRQMVRLITDAGLAGEVQPTDSTFGIIRDGRVHVMASDSTLDGLRTGLLSARAKARLIPMIWDVLRAGGRLDYADFTKAAPLDTESLRAYAQRRTRSSEVIDYLVEPLSIGFFGASSDVVSRVGFMFGLKNFIFGGHYFNSPTGIDFLPKGLARGLDVRMNARVREVQAHPGGVRVSWDGEGGSCVDEAAAAVLAVPAPAMLGMHPGLDVQRRAIVERIEYGRGVTVSFGLAHPPPAPCSLVLVPPCEHPDLLAILYEHRKAPGRAPEGKGLVSLYWQPRWSEQHWDSDDETIAADARAAVAPLMPGLLDSVEMSHVSRWNPALARGRTGLYRDLARFAQLSDPSERIQLAGDYLGFSTTGCSLASGERAAARVADALHSTRSRAALRATT